MDEVEIATRLTALAYWTREGDSICRTFHFRDHYEVMAFANAVAWVSHETDHHPEMTIGYNSCKLCYTTHSTGGLSPKDFACAARADALLGR